MVYNKKFPLLKYMFRSKDYSVEILENSEGITDLGLPYVNNEMCYPIVLMVGQVVDYLKSGKNLMLSKMYRNFDLICQDFAGIGRSAQKKQIIAICGEFYAKYCALGNWDVIRYIEENGGESFTNGCSWYMLYYIESHMPDNNGMEKAGFLAARALLKKAQNKMIASMIKYGFHSLKGLKTLRDESQDYVSKNLKVGDGWLIGAEVIGCAKSGIKKILCVAPFGCMATACSGRGLFCIKVGERFQMRLEYI